MEKTNVIKLKYLRAGQPSGREYTFYTPAPVEVGDIVDIAVVNAGTGMSQEDYEELAKIGTCLALLRS